MSTISTVNPTTLFPTTTITTPGGSSNHILDSSLVGTAIPTNQWWANAILQDDTDGLYAYPYNFKCQSTTSPAGLQVGISNPSSTTNTVFGNYALTFNVTMVESYATNKRTLMSSDDMGFKMRWLQATAGNYFESYIYRGQTTVAVYFNNVTPKIDTGGGVALTFPGTTGVNYIKFTTNSSQTWVIQTPANQSWTTTGTTAQMTGVYTGWVFFTYLPSVSYESTITSYVGAVVTGTSVSPSISGNNVNVKYTYTVSSQISGKTTPLVALLTHHNNRITNSNLIVSSLNGQYSCLRGPMYAAAATSMTFQIPLIATPTQYETVPTGSKLTAITSQLAIDKTITANGTDPYGLGKQFGKLGTLAGIADLLSDSTSATSIRGNLKSALTTALNLTPSGTNFGLEYETNWLGMMPHTDDFGSRDYNDHHFHWGYWMYGAGMLAKSDTSWFSTNSQQEKVNVLARDFANPDPVADPYFPRYRNMDLYEFHSWAHGILTSGDGKDQESDTEAINAYYGLALWGQYSSNTVAQQTGQCLLSMEVEGVKNYYHLTAGTSVINKQTGLFKHTVPGILFLGKFDYATFFDGHHYAIHGIHNFPITPVSIYAHLSDFPWVCEDNLELADEIYSEISGSPYANAWFHFFIQELAVFQPDLAWTMANAGLTNIDDGTTLTNILTFIATRSGRKRPITTFNRTLATRSTTSRTTTTRSMY